MPHMFCRTATRSSPSCPLPPSWLQPFLLKLTQASKQFALYMTSSMSSSWWTWSADVDAAIKELQKVESEKDTLLKRVEVLESRNESLMANVEWLMKKLDQQDNKPTELPTPPTSTSIALALHGGFTGPQPLRQPTPLPPPPPQLVHPAPPSEEHAAALRDCMQNR